VTVGRSTTKGKTKPQCHPNRTHYAKGLCASCYHTQAKKKQQKQPVRVIHTHEIIRQVQHEEKQTMPAAHENDKPKTKATSTTVTSDVGESHPPTVFGGECFTPIAEWPEIWAKIQEENAKADEKARAKAAEDAGNVMTTAKGK
jgi:hypothetical protein